MDKKSQNFLLFTRNTISVDFSPSIIDTKEDFCLLCLWIDFFSLSPFLLEFLLCVYKDVPAMKRWWVCSIYWTGALSEEVKDSGCTWLIPVQNRYLITCSLAIQRNYIDELCDKLLEKWNCLLKKSLEINIFNGVDSSVIGFKQHIWNSDLWE